MAALIVSIVLGYGLGNIQTAYLLGRWIGKIDIRKHGTTNAGASNAAVTLGLGYGIVTFIIDGAKGFLALFLVRQWFPEQPTLPLVTGIFAVLGHIYPFYLEFRGGKGMAALFGVLLAADWRLGLTAFGIQALVTVVGNYVALGSLVVLVLLPFITYYMDPSPIRMGLILGISALLVYQHLPNLRKIISGKEKKFWAVVLKKGDPSVF